MQQQPLKATRKPRPEPVAPTLPTPSPSTSVAPRSNGQSLPRWASSSAASPSPAKAVRTGGIHVFNVYKAQCPAQKALDAIASKWAILILHRLIEHPLRFNALQRELPGISQKVLTQQLRRLEKFGLLHRTVHATVPPSVEYTITSAGRELKDSLASLCDWATKHAALLGLPDTEAPSRTPSGK
jgi:DNA-binding HxlR family transcriptional regulator